MLRIVPKEFWRNASVLLLWRWWYAGRSASWRGSDNWLASSDPVYKQMRNCIGLKILMRDEGLQMVGRYLFIIIEDIITPLVLWLLSTDVWLIQVVLAPPGETLFTLLVRTTDRGLYKMWKTNTKDGWVRLEQEMMSCSFQLLHYVPMIKTLKILSTKTLDNFIFQNLITCVHYTRTCGHVVHVQVLKYK